MSVLAPEQYAVYLITDNPSRYAGDFVESVERAVAGGVTLAKALRLMNDNALPPPVEQNDAEATFARTQFCAYLWYERVWE